MWSLVLFACVDPDPCGPVEESVDDTYTGWANVSVITGAETAWMVALDWDDLIWRPLVGDQVASEGSTVALYHRFTSNSVLGAQWISPTEVAVFTEQQ